MEHTSLRHHIWASDRPFRVGSITFNEYTHICAAFDQAELYDEATAEVRSYRADWNIWVYLFGDDAEFPGIDPARGPTSRSGAPSPTAINAEPAPSSPYTERPQTSYFPPDDVNAATEMHELLLSSWNSRPQWKGYTPQFGFNPSTGEPYMSVRCYAANAYSSLIGPSFRYLKTLEKWNPESVIRFERFEGYLLVWPEFKELEDLLNEDAGERYSILRGFLRDWGALRGEVAPAFKLYDRWMHDGGRPEGPPEGFVLKDCVWYQRAVKKNARKFGNGRSDSPEVEREVFPRKSFALTRGKRGPKKDKAVGPKEEEKNDRPEKMEIEGYEEDDKSSYKQVASSVVGWEENLEYGDRSHDERVYAEKKPYNDEPGQEKAKSSGELADRPNLLQNPNKIPLPRRPADRLNHLQSPNEIPLPRRPVDYPDPLQNPNKIPLPRRSSHRRDHSPSRGRDTRMIDSYRPRPDDEKRQSRNSDQYRPKDRYRPKRE